MKIAFCYEHVQPARGGCGTYIPDLARRLTATLARWGKALDLAHWSFARLERRQYLTHPRPLVIVNSEMVRNHFQRFYGIGPDQVRVIYSSIDPQRFADPDRPRRRAECRG